MFKYVPVKGTVSTTSASNKRWIIITLKNTEFDHKLVKLVKKLKLNF